MINLLLGTSGGGKSFEAVVYHILPSLEMGRKVITNLPLNIDAFNAINLRFGSLIELRTRPQPIRGLWLPTEDEAFELYKNDIVDQPDQRARVFSKVWDYYDDWKHPDTGVGALFVIDECQYSIPRGRTDISVEEYTALHRHYKVDILYITQSYGKVSKTIIDNLQMVYRVRKQTAFGRDTHYIRKVQDGVRGEVMSISSREYISAYFPLYRSHTQSGSTGSETGANDVKPIWKHWSFQMSAICFIIFFGMLFSGTLSNPLKPKALNEKPQLSKTDFINNEFTQTLKSQDQIPKATLAVYKQSQPSQKYREELQEEKTIEHPFLGYGIHISGSGYYRMPGNRVYFYSLLMSQNGQVVSSLSDNDLKKVGYKTEAYSKCSLKITYGEHVQWVTCDSPQVSITATL